MTRRALKLIEWPTCERARPPGVRKLANRYCFQNALHYVLRFHGKGWRYCEGIATSGGLPYHHAWCIDEHGFVVETTWAALGTKYIGMVHPVKAVIRRQFDPTLKRWDTPSMYPGHAYLAALGGLTTE